LMAVCAGYKRDGTRCTVTVEPPQTHCWWHDPDNAEVRKRAAAKGGRARPSRELVAVKSQLQDMADGVLSGEVDRAGAAVVGQLLNIKLRAIEQERKTKETEDLEARIEALESTQGQKGARKWGA
jgi:hypothetical protein